jgi:hypothetical protein
MAAVIRTGERGVDFSFSKPPAARLVELGYNFVVGYISIPPASPSKNLTKAQCEAYIAAGLKVLVVWEMDAARPNKGATYGELDGKAARLEAIKLGYPVDEVSIITACDLNSFLDNIDQHERYVRGFHKTSEQEFIGLYGDTDILARTTDVWNIGWVPVGAWAWSGTSYANAVAKAHAIGAHVLQQRGFWLDNQWAVDPNDAIADFPAWGTPTQPPQGDDMTRSKIFTIFNDKRTSYCWIKVDENDRVRQVANGDEYQDLVNEWGAIEKKNDEEVSVGIFRQMIKTYEPVGSLNANSIDVLGNDVAIWWERHEYPDVVLPPAPSGFPRRVVLEGMVE